MKISLNGDYVCYRRDGSFIELENITSDTCGLIIPSNKQMQIIERDEALKLFGFNTKIGHLWICDFELSEFVDRRDLMIMMLVYDLRIQ